MTHNGSVVMQNKRLFGIMLGATLLLLVPAVAMLFTGEMNWGPEDFIAAAVLLFGTGALFEMFARRASGFSYKLGAGLALFGVFALIWVNLAVGLIGNEENPANLLYLGVVGTFVIGSGIARFRALGMAKVMFATAIVHFLVPFVAMMIWRPPFGPGVVAVIFLNSVFVLMFAGSGFLFRSAGEREMRG